MTDYQMKSPYLITEHSSDDDFAALQKRVYFRAAKEVEKQTWWDFIINAIILALCVAGVTWLWDLIR
jgi:hypothetical protein